MTNNIVFPIRYRFSVCYDYNRSGVYNTVQTLRVKQIIHHWDSRYHDDFMVNGHDKHEQIKQLLKYGFKDGWEEAFVCE